jgi:hypothetical protein
MSEASLFVQVMGRSFVMLDQSTPNPRGFAAAMRKSRNTRKQEGVKPSVRALIKGVMSVALHPCNRARPRRSRQTFAWPDLQALCQGRDKGEGVVVQNRLLKKAQEALRVT